MGMRVPSESGLTQLGLLLENPQTAQWDSNPLCNQPLRSCLPVKCSLLAFGIPSILVKDLVVTA